MKPIEEEVVADLGHNYEAWRLPILETGEYLQLPEREKLSYLLSLGHLAGSSHNTQPWAFRMNVENMAVEAYLDRERVLPVSDVIGRQAVVSVGWAMGNMITAGTRYGYGVELELEEVCNEDVKPAEVDSNTRYRKLGQVRLDRLENENIGLAGMVEAMMTRRVERREYDRGRDFNPDLYEKMENMFKRENGLGLVVWRRGDMRINGLAEMQAFADGFVANSKKFSSELAKWFVVNDTESGLGMPGATFSLSDLKTRQMIAGLSGQTEIEADNLVGFSQSGKKGIESAACVGMLTAKDQTVSSWLQVGMRLGAIANMIEEVGGSMAVHAGLAEVKAVGMGLAGIGMTTQKPVILFRAGLRHVGEERLPHSPRLPIEDVII